MEIHYIGATWCAPCRTTKPKAKDLAEQAKLPFAERDYDKDLSEEEQSKIVKLPTIRLMEKGVVQAEFTTGTAADSFKLYLQSKKILPEEEF
jgi:thiol-disulfide isomerase/thioredoxin